ncbi:lytic transglycosylase domain-containing protein [Methylocystis sp. ATCC 49242]|uniref:lytic transglycosylase domain-containing protein n=1 Tax=Methylocystis sp. ATCC 49242 TaxID=622637 RepID=UPI0001F86F1B|nr:lytic transglycosylase domain-containing protein [Methylocystis sp. ATCC 49242]
MMLPSRVSTRLKLLSTATAIALITPAFTGFSDMGDGEAKRTENRWIPSVPFSLGAWRSRVGSLEESLRGFVTGVPAGTEEAHPPQAALFGADDGPLSPLAAYAPADGWLKGGTGPSPLDPAKLLGDDSEVFAQTLAFYKAGDFAAAEQAAANLQAKLPDTAARWGGLRLHPREAGFKRIAGFLADHPDWPAAEWLRKRAEESLVAEHQADKVVRAWFADSKPITAYGKYALAKALARDGDFEAAARLARDAWREDDLGQSFETMFRKDLGDFLTVEDHKYRADRLLYSGKNALALRAAELAGKDVTLLARVRAAAWGGAGGDRLYASVPPSLQNDPGLLFSRVHSLTNAKKYAEAAALLRKAPQEPERVIDGDAWWAERRQVSRKVLDMGDAETAYVIAAQHRARSTSNKVEAEFQAGWIALRFLDDPARASRHFATLEQVAETPLQKSRALYWRGRAYEAMRTPEDDARARGFYQMAAAHSTTFYGQLANAKLGAADKPLRTPPEATKGDQRHEAVRVVELLLATGDKEIAAPLALEAAKNVADPKHVAALGEVIASQRDAKLSLIFGKSASYRGVPLDDVAFPSYGVPNFEALPKSASRSVVYAIARQESAFDPKAVSSAGAMGLMQMIASTARHTAYQHGVGFDLSRMLNEPAFNAQLGAAHLGILLGEYRGAYLLTFAAYNAGGGRVKQWIDAYGDPRKPNVDPIDWVERIPITETRNYVQRVMENFVVYRAKFGDTDTRAPQMELARAGDGL